MARLGLLSGLGTRYLLFDDGAKLEHWRGDWEHKGALSTHEMAFRQKKASCALACILFPSYSFSKILQLGRWPVHFGPCINVIISWIAHCTWSPGCAELEARA